MKKLYIISADLDKLQKIFNDSIESSQKYEGEQWKLYHEGFDDALKMFTESIDSYKVCLNHIPRIIEDLSAIKEEQ